ncbi:MAG: hypothetical protein ACR2N0_08650 [Rubrobacteraceae bacterium]
MSEGRERGGKSVRYAIIGATAGAVVAFAVMDPPGVFAIAAFAFGAAAIGMIVELVRQRGRDT